MTKLTHHFKEPLRQNIGIFMSEPTVVKEEQSKITSVKPKDPKKVEAGRRLGQISKQIREQKMRARIAAEKEAERGEGWSMNYAYMIGIGGLVLAAISVYYARAEHKRETRRLGVKDQVVITEPPADSLPPGNFLDSFE